MNVSNFAIPAIAALALTACSNPGTEETVTEEVVIEETGVSGNYAVDTTSSQLAWEGNMLKVGGVSVYGHSGDLEIQKGTLQLENGKVVDGMIVVDMTSISPTDSAYDEAAGHTKAKLVGHLSSPDFFAVEEYPTATFKITGMEDNKIMGDMTIRGVTHPETIELTNVEMSPEQFKAEGALVLDRQKYNVAYKHAAKDMAVSDDLELDFVVVASSK